MTNESFISLVDAANTLPRRNGKKIHWKTIRRWILKGIKGIRLAAMKIGGVWHTKPSWLDEFNQRCTQESLGTAQRHPAIRRASRMKARMELQRSLGINGNQAG